MRGFNVALITEEQLHLVPRELPAEWIADKQGIQSFRRGAASEAYAERSIGLRCGVRGLDEFFRGALGDCGSVLQDSHIGVCAIVRHATKPAFTAIPNSRCNARLSRDDSGSVCHGGAAPFVDFLFTRPPP